MSLIISCLAFLTFQTVVQSLSGTAQLTWYISYAPCCPENSNYDPNADTTECVQYSACSYSGDFWAIGHKPYKYVQNTNMVAFFDPSDRNGDNFMTNYGGKEITLSKNGVNFTAIIADSCSDSDCSGCCTTNSQPSGFLVDMEYWTAINNFGSINDIDGQIQFTIGNTAKSSTSTSSTTTTTLASTTTTTTSTTSSTSTTTIHVPTTSSSSTSSTTTATSTNTHVNGNIIITNQASTNLWWVAFFITNIDLTCGGSITNVEITDNNHYSGTWIGYDDNQYGYYSFAVNAFTEPISIRITKSYQGSNESIVRQNLVDLTGDKTFDFGYNFCGMNAAITTNDNYENMVGGKDTTTELLIGLIISLGLIILQIIMVVIYVCKRRKKQVYENNKSDKSEMIFTSTLKMYKKDDVSDGGVNTETQTNIVASNENDYDNNDGLFID